MANPTDFWTWYEDWQKRHPGSDSIWDVLRDPRVSRAQLLAMGWHEAGQYGLVPPGWRLGPSKDPATDTVLGAAYRVGANVVKVSEAYRGRRDLIAPPAALTSPKLGKRELSRPDEVRIYLAAHGGTDPTAAKARALSTAALAARRVTGQPIARVDRNERPSPLRNIPVDLFTRPFRGPSLKDALDDALSRIRAAFPGTR